MSKSSWVIEQSKLSNRASDIALQKGSEDSLSSIETTFKAAMAVENNLASKSGEVVIEVSSNENSYVEKDCLSISSAIDEDFVKEIIDIENQFSAVGKESVNIFSSVEEVNGIDRMDSEEELVQATVLVENCFFQNSNQASSGFEKEATIRAGVAKSGSKKGSLDMGSECFFNNTLPQGLFSNLSKVLDFILNGCVAFGDIVEEKLNLIVLEDYKMHKWSVTKTVVPLTFLKEDLFILL
ncbi:hypothetical protein Q3G72_033898 [Acer saccharum]|nr:hypothetical protein Q3G72_033898 [Acer saccharum]